MAEKPLPTVPYGFASTTSLSILSTKDQKSSLPPETASSICILTESASETLEREGGRAAWLTVTGSVLVYYSSFGIINSFGFFQEYYQQDFLRSIAPSTIAFIGTLQIMLMNVLASVSGTLVDIYGVKVSLNFILRFLTACQKPELKHSFSTCTLDLALEARVPCSYYLSRRPGR